MHHKISLELLSTREEILRYHACIAPRVGETVSIMEESDTDYKTYSVLHIDHAVYHRRLMVVAAVEPTPPKPAIKGPLGGFSSADLAAALATIRKLNLSPMPTIPPYQSGPITVAEFIADKQTELSTAEETVRSFYQNRSPEDHPAFPFTGLLRAPATPTAD